jgi:hypothetical protein
VRVLPLIKKSNCRLILRAAYPAGLLPRFGGCPEDIRKKNFWFTRLNLTGRSH